ncbi:MAG: GNAT family N-acetyltransferase [Chitinophagaceae bacterium]
MSFTITTLSSEPGIISTLANLIIETVANGGSVSFMHPMDPQMAVNFWTNSLAAAGRGERVVLGAWHENELVGTVTLLLDCPPNQPHRAEIAKMMTRVAWRGRGIARSLLQEAERLAVENGRTLLNLDTAADEGAAGFYERQGYIKAGVIPDYALKPLGGFTDTILYYKRIGLAAPSGE